MTALYIAGLVVFSLLTVVAAGVMRGTQGDDGFFDALGNFPTLLMLLPVVYAAQHSLARTTYSDDERARASRRVLLVVGGMTLAGALLTCVQSAALGGSGPITAVTVILGLASVGYSLFVGRRISRRRQSTSETGQDTGSASGSGSAAPVAASSDSEAIEPVHAPRHLLPIFIVAAVVGFVAPFLVTRSTPLDLAISIALSLVASGVVSALVSIAFFASTTSRMRKIAGESPIGGGPITRAVLQRKRVDLDADQRSRAEAYARSFLNLMPYSLVILGYFFVSIAAGSLVVLSTDDSPSSRGLFAVLLLPVAIVVLVVVFTRQIVSARRYLTSTSS
ncbi:hypothetical protein [Herbiconiux sp. L3-i23]|uniref:hypothetical protein n=1 Tax=Herbiconiux sp. L3-i23 TaxID=2905871 RepID=UPI002058F80B|nr:hypothetical protein [Herbiconiux sp. L3-i23]BDI23066.1 hypothetical protein L3i23_18420 [Herbiconiux sp. L3-i23]